MRLISDFALAITCIWQEARGEPYAGKVAVAEVIRNRMKVRRKNAAAVVLEPYQFSGFNTKDPNRTPSFLIEDTDEVVMDCMRAWIASEDSALTEGATLYANLSILPAAPAWADPANQTVKIGNHTFFREGGPVAA